MSSPLTEALSRPFSLKPLMSSSHCDFRQMLGFFGCKWKVASSWTCLKIRPLLSVLNTCGNMASYVYVSLTATKCPTHLLLRALPGTLVQLHGFSCPTTAFSNGQLYHILCISLSRVSGNVEEIDKMVKARLKPKARLPNIGAMHVMCQDRILAAAVLYWNCYQSHSKLSVTANWLSICMYILSKLWQNLPGNLHLSPYKVSS